MRLFRRGPSEGSPTDFWAWWAGARDQVATGVETGGLSGAVVADISRAVTAVHRDMAWELGPGRSARHAFCISPEGDPALRQVALRWLADAPPADATWEYHASKQANPSLDTLRLDVGGQTFALAEMRAIASWDETRRRVDVRLWHPGFETAPANVRVQVMFIFLDNLVGEDEVERWIGEVEALDAPTGGRTPDELRAEIGRRREEDPGGDASWILGERTARDGSTELVLFDAALKRIDHPFADIHVAMAIRLDGAGGLPDDAEAEQLNAEEDALVATLPGVAQFAGRTTTRGLRTLHFVTADEAAMKAAIDAWALDLPPRHIKVDLERDMGWEFRREFGL